MKKPPLHTRRQAILDAFQRSDLPALRDAAEAASADYSGESFFWKALGVARNLLGQRGDAVIGPFAEAARLNPDDAEVFDGLAQALARAGRLDEAVAAGERAVTMAPRHAYILTNHGNLLASARRIGEAVALHRRAVALQPGLAEAWSNLGAALRATPWRHDEAAAAFGRALTIHPAGQAAWDNLLFLRQYQSGVAALEIFRETLTAACNLTLTVRPRPRPAARPLAGRPLRVGWVSADLRQHPVGRALTAILPHLAGHGVEVFAYSNTSFNDDVSQRIAAGVAAWRVVAELSDEALTDLIHADAVDVLVDLSGRTRGHRLGVFARRAAPAQVCWLGWFSSSGLPQIDWYLGDHLTLPAAERALFAEHCWAIDGPYYVQPVHAFADGAAIDPAVVDDGGPIRFGCFNSLPKLSARTLDLWARILVALPAASLRVLTKDLGDPAVAAELTAEFARRGVSADRLRLSSSLPIREYLAAYRQIDVALDPTPYTGGATSHDSLWMGVPVLTLRGDRLIAHQGEDLLRRLGLDDWVATDEAQYVARAVAAAGRTGQLRRARAALRESYLASPLVDGAALAAQVAAAWRDMHRRSLDGPPPRKWPDDPVARQAVEAIWQHLDAAGG